MTPMIRTLGPVWLAALALTIAAALCLGAALFWPPAATGSGTPAQSSSGADLFAALTAGDGARMRDDLRALAPQLAGNARGRLEQILAAEERRLAEAPPALVLSGFANRLDAALVALHSGVPVAAPGGEALGLAGAAAAMAAALLALLAGPLALGPLRGLRAGLGSAAIRQRRDLWGDLAREVATQPPAPAPSPGPDIAALLEGAGSELARLRLESAAVAQGFRDMEADRERLGATAAVTHARLEEAAAMADRAAEGLATLPRLTAAQSDAILTLAGRLDRAEAAVGLAERLETALPPVLAAIDASLSPDQLILLDRLSARLEAAAERLAGEADAAPSAAAAFQEAVSQLSLTPIAQTADRLAGIADGLGELAAQQAAPLARIEAVAMRLPAHEEAIGAAIAGATVQAGRLEAVAGNLPGVTKQLEAAVAALPRLGAIAAGLKATREAIPPLVDRQAELLVRLEAATKGLPALATRQEATAESLAATLRDALPPIGERQEQVLQRLEALADRVPETLDPPSAGLDNLEETLRGALSPIAETLHRLDAATERLPAWTQVQEQSVARLEAAAREALPIVADRQAALLDRMEATAAAVEGLAAQHAGAAEAARAQQAALSGIEQLTATLPDLAERQTRAASRLEMAGNDLPAIARRQDEAASRLTEAGEALLARIEAAVAALPLHVASAVARSQAPATTDYGTRADPTPSRPEASVAATILDQLGAAAPSPAVSATLHRLDGVETEVARLLREAEAIVGTDTAHVAAALPLPVAQRVPELLDSIDVTIRRLQSVSTAIAMAGDRRLLASP